MYKKMDKNILILLGILRDKLKRKDENDDDN